MLAAKVQTNLNKLVLAGVLGRSYSDWSSPLVSVFFECSRNEDSIPLTAVCTQAGKYGWTLMTMGLASSLGWFQSIILRVCDGLKRVRLFIDDIVRFSKNGAEHVCDLKSFFERLTMFDVKLAPKKAHLGMHVIKVLGHRVTARGVEPDPDKVE